MAPNLSLNPGASPAALTRRPLGAGYLGSLDVAMQPFVDPPLFRIGHVQFTWGGSS